LTEIILSSKRLEDYLRLVLHYGDFSLIPPDASYIKVSDIKKLSGGMTNNIYSFSLTFTNKGFKQHFDLVLKAYSEFVGLWFKINHPDEDRRRYVREFQVLKSLSNVGFPVPTVYLCECDSFFLGFPFLIMSKEKTMQESVNKLDYFAITLARLHNLRVKELEIRALRFPKNDIAFARERPICLKYYLNETRHYRKLRENFNYALNWLESKAIDNNCPQYCLIHGEYHPGHVLIENDNKINVIDWESVQIGDPAFDVGYAYNVIKLMYTEKNSNSGEKVAERFVSEYSKEFRGDIHQRLEFYKVVGLLGVAVVVSSWISTPIEAYKRLGYKSFLRSLAFPFFPSQFLVQKWLNSDFLVSYLQYCQSFIKTTLRR
jgi:aminoglycoside phosphotransferase (APT) family kinase protein